MAGSEITNAYQGLLETMHVYLEWLKIHSAVVAPADEGWGETGKDGVRKRAEIFEDYSHFLKPHLLIIMYIYYNY